MKMIQKKKLAGLVAALAITAYGGVGQANTVSLVPTSPTTIGIGGIVSYDIALNLTTSVQGGRMILSFDTAFLDSQDPPGFTFAAGVWNDGGGLDIAEAIVDEGAGTIDIQTSAGFDTFSGMLTLGSLNFIGTDVTPAASITLGNSGVPSTSQWPNATFVGSEVAVVPIPAAAILFGTGIVGLLGIGSRKKAIAA